MQVWMSVFANIVTVGIGPGFATFANAPEIGPDSPGTSVVGDTSQCLFTGLSYSAGLAASRFPSASGCKSRSTGRTDHYLASAKNVSIEYYNSYKFTIIPDASLSSAADRMYPAVTPCAQMTRSMHPADQRLGILDDRRVDTALVTPLPGLDQPHPQSACAGVARQRAVQGPEIAAGLLGEDDISGVVGRASLQSLGHRHHRWPVSSWCRTTGTAAIRCHVRPTFPESSCPAESALASALATL
jgi:hypothetical protein